MSTTTITTTPSVVVHKMGGQHLVSVEKQESPEVTRKVMFVFEKLHSQDRWDFLEKYAQKIVQDQDRVSAQQSMMCTEQLRLSAYLEDRGEQLDQMEMALKREPTAAPAPQSATPVLEAPPASKPSESRAVRLWNWVGEKYENFSSALAEIADVF